MLNKEVILKGLKDENKIVREAIFDYICNLNLYSDEDINDRVIWYIKKYYKEINYAKLTYSKTNKKIVECIANIALKADSNVKKRMNLFFLEHYNFLKDLDYDCEKIIEGENELLIYKKVKHFSKKDPSKLIEMYKNNINEYYFVEDEESITIVLRGAMRIALAQTEEGIKKIKEYINELKIKEGEEKFIEKYMPILVYPLCQSFKEDFYNEIFNLYVSSDDFGDFGDRCLHYFSNICNENVINYYIEKLKKLTKDESKCQAFLFAAYLKSDALDNYIFKELEKNKNIKKKIKKYIIAAYSMKLDKRIIPYALNELKREEDKFLEETIAPLLIMEKCEDKQSKKIIKKVEEMTSNDGLTDILNNITENQIAEILSNFRMLILDQKPHIKEYKKARKLHGEILSSMMDYYEQGKFELKFNGNVEKLGLSNLKFIKSYFNTSTQVGKAGYVNILCYKNSANMNCLTEEFIEKKRFRKQEKIDFLESMLNSKAGLFEILSIDESEAEVHLRNVLTKEEYSITDISLSNVLKNEIYMYLRIITYKDISFATGNTIVFSKKDPFIMKWIKENSKKSNKQELVKYLELYNEYIKDDKGFKMHTNEM